MSLYKIVSTSVPFPSSFPDPLAFSDNPCAYLTHVAEFSAITLHSIALALSLTLQNVHCGFKYCIVATGSDGRGEKSVFSKTELILICDLTSQESDLAKALRETLLSHIDTHSDQLHPSLEVKFLKSSNPLTYLHSTRGTELFFPTRCFDSVLLCGCPHFFSEYKHLAVSHMTVKCVGEVRTKQLLPSVRVLLSSSEEHFSLSTGELFHANLSVERRSAGTKYGHLRAFQYKVMHLIGQCILQKISIGSDLPNGVTHRLTYLHSQGILKITKEELDCLVHDYQHCLLWYHQSEQLHSQGRGPLKVDCDLLSAVTERVTAFCQTDSLRLLGRNSKGAPLSKIPPLFPPVLLHKPIRHYGEAV